MATGFIEGLVSRHGKKEYQIAEKFAGSSEDKAIPLNAAGIEQMQAVGRDNLKPNFYGILDTTTSPFARTRQSAHEMLTGAGYNPHCAARTEREDIGLAACNWLAPGVPLYNPATEAAYVGELLEQFWMGPQTEDRQPVLASFAYGLLDGLIQGIERVQPYVREGVNAAVLEVTHGPIIDTLDAAIFETVPMYMAESKGKIRNFPGNYSTGEVITFTSAVANPTNPVFKFLGKERQKSLNLDDLKFLRDQVGRNAQGRF